MTKTFIGGILLGTMFVFGAIVPLVLIGLLGLGVGIGAAVLRGGRRFHIRTAYGQAPEGLSALAKKALSNETPPPSQRSIRSA